MSVIVLQNSDDRLYQQFLSIQNFCNQISLCCHDEEVIIDFSEVTFVHPFYILCLSAVLDHFNTNSKMHLRFDDLPSSVSTYLDLIKFPYGLRPDEYHDWQETLNHYVGKTYLPILNFPSHYKYIELRNSFLSHVNHLINTRLHPTTELFSAISYLISEITDNIVDHSGVDRGWLTVQYYEHKSFFDICIADSGRTIHGSYLFNGIVHGSETESVVAALNGKSTKSPERGRGIPTSVSMIVEGLRGNILMVSGGAFLANTKIFDSQIKLPGTFFVLRLPIEVSGFQYSKYIY
ncbi:MAG: hypothetical protein WC865_17280 [Bacteroidales bacterium]